MLSEVAITNYRCFPSYSMKGLRHVNLLVGRNNSGKTALLEAIQLLASGGDPGVLEEIAHRRGELIFSRPAERQAVDISHFFHGHGVAIGAAFEVKGNNGHPPVRVRLAGRGDKATEADEQRPSRRGGVVLSVEGGRPTERGQRMFNITREGGFDFESPRRNRLGFPEPSLFRRHDEAPVRFVSTDSLSMMTLAALWDEVTLNGLEDEVGDALRVLEDRVQSVHMLTGAGGLGYYVSRAGVVVGMQDHPQRIPLGSMGDGMRRMLALATSLACAAEGALFVDEIDTGLHYSIMNDMWRLVVERAKKTNVQVFATTHSWDCIEGLSVLCQDHPEFHELVAVHTIDRSLDRSVVFAGESVARMERQQIDPR